MDNFKYHVNHPATYLPEIRTEILYLMCVLNHNAWIICISMDMVMLQNSELRAIEY
jgi:hypothetical protein